MSGQRAWWSRGNGGAVNRAARSAGLRRCRLSSSLELAGAHRTALRARSIARRPVGQLSLLRLGLAGAARCCAPTIFTLGPATHLLVKYVLRIGVVFYGGNFAVRRDALERIGGFDTTIEFHGEDTNLGRRLSRIGNVALRYDCFLYTSARRYNAMGKGRGVPALRSQLRFRAVAPSAKRPSPPGRSSVRIFSIDNRKPQARYVVRALCLKKARLP